MEQESPLRQRTKAYALRIIKLSAALPRMPAAQVIGQQLLRSGTSVGANYREGSGERSSAEMAAKFGICIQELDETAYWLELLVEAELVAEPLLSPLLEETNQLMAMFTSAVRKLRSEGRAP